MLAGFLCIALAAHAALAAGMVMDKQVKSQPVQSDVVVVGGGLAGLAVANGLGAKGLKVHVLEKTQGFPMRGSTLALAPNGFKAIAELSESAADRIRQMGVSIDTSPEVAYTDKGTRVTKFKASSRGDSASDAPIVLPWFSVRDVLKDSLHPSVSIETGCEVEEINDSHEAGCVSIKLSSGVVHQARLLIGADGVNSYVRKHLSMPAAISRNSQSMRGAFVADDNEMNMFLRFNQSEQDIVSIWNKAEGLTASTFHLPGNKICWNVFRDQGGDVGSLENVKELIKVMPKHLQYAIEHTDIDSVRKGDLRVIPLPDRLASDASDADESVRVDMTGTAVNAEGEPLESVAHFESASVNEVGFGGRGRICLIGGRW